ncbi:unnamed protein product [Lactuca saligna]|uniref:Protein FAR1-RELATED SEQUENCE n=1 Tax=Lactuca saligna TaxID=75948 RepID=A0AA36E0K4_LACSI|nr:unnamed protein product [Lactuca saligna]
MMFETEVNVHPIETHIVENVAANDLSNATYESEKIDGVDVNFECEKDESIVGKGTNEPYRKILVCDKEGFKREDGDTSSGHEKKHRREVKIGCKAMLRISKKNDGKWFVELFDDMLNHELSSTPTKVMKHRSHVKFHRTTVCKSLMLKLNQLGLKPSQIKKAINAMKTSNEVDVTSKQCVDVLSEQRKHNRGREFYGLIKHLQDKALLDNDQYYVVDLCSDGYPRNIFWAGGRSRDDFTKFGDVVVFDVTYMTNKFKMPFAPFTGVNHHGHSIRFGGALLENEKEETFVWLFEPFLKFTSRRVAEEDEDFKTMNSRAAEEDEDFKTMNSRSVLSSIHPIEAKAGGTLMLGTRWDQAIQKKSLPVENVSQGPSVRISQVDMMPQLSVRDPLGPTNTKGRPKIASRIKSSLEVPKKRTRSYCQGLGHYATSCSKRKVDESLQEKQ